MIYNFYCDNGNCVSGRIVKRSIGKGPPSWVKCPECGMHMKRDWLRDRPNIDTSACRDSDEIPYRDRVSDGSMSGPGKSGAKKKERQFQEHVSERRKLLEDGGNRGSFRHTYSVPADLFHGKIKETGDRNYWSDPKNVARHRSCKVGR